MKKLFSFIAAALLSASAYPAANDTIFAQYDPGFTYVNTWLVPIPASGANGFYILDGASSMPKMGTMGTGLQLSGGVVSATAVSAVNADWSAVSGLAQILNKPTAVSAFTNDAGYIIGVTSGQITAALGFTPYDATNPSSYINQAGARSAISLTVTGSGAASYNSSTGVLNVPTPPVPATGTVTSVGLTSSNLTITGSPVTTSGNLTVSMPNVGTAGTYDATMTTDAQGRVTAGTSKSQSAQTRSLNSAFQISATRATLAIYSVKITTTVSIGSNQDGDVILEIASDSGFTANVQTLSVGSSSQTVTLAIALNSIQANTIVVSGYVPVGYYTRLRTVNVTGTPAFAYRTGQEVLM